ncbi:MAG: hypothetical protein R3C14_48935 [Caldilineaceae bacterium]
MVTMFIKSKVRDYEVWKRFYDDFAPKRKETGVTGAAVYCDPADPTVLTVTHQFATLAEARAFAGWEELRSAMMASGVEGAPEIWFAEDVEQTAC